MITHAASRKHFILFYWTAPDRELFWLLGNFLFDEEVAWNQKQIGADPCQHFGDENAVFTDERREEQRTTGTHDKFCHAGQHGKYRIAHALYRRTGHMENVKKR